MTMKAANIRVRLITWYVFSLGCVHILVGTGLYRLISEKLHHELDQRLSTYTTCLVELLPEHRHVGLSRVIGEMAELSALGSGLYALVADRDGKVVYETPDVSSDLRAVLRDTAGFGEHRPKTLRIGSLGSWRMMTRQVYEDGQFAYTGQVAIPLTEVQRALGKLRFILLAVVPCVMALASIGAWMLLNRALAPLHDVIRTARTIQAKDFGKRLPVPDTGDEVEALAGTFNDMMGRLDRSFARMREFISDASHELRTPLAVLQGEVELGLKSASCCDRCQEVLVTCACEIERMSRLVETLLFLSHADAEKISMDLKSVNVSRVVDEIAQEARILAERKQIRVELANQERVRLMADEMKLKQLLLNLVDNAVKYTPEGGRIQLHCRRITDRVELMVADSGIGISEDDLPRIFDRFYRADRSRSRASGSYGLGLSICKWITEAHGGSIHATSAPGKGSSFFVNLPLA